MLSRPASLPHPINCSHDSISKIVKLFGVVDQSDLITRRTPDTGQPYVFLLYLLVRDGLTNRMRMNKPLCL